MTHSSGIYASNLFLLPWGIRVHKTPKRAPSYFQKIMATIVLVGLICMICDMYIDDCIVFVDKNKEFVSRLDVVLGRFRKHNLFLKASKCSFGSKELEFVGKVVSEAGLKVSQVDFPTNGKIFWYDDLFKRFVRNHSKIVKPLHDLIANYDKHRKIVWTPETTAASNEMKLQVSRCSTMHFMSDAAPIALCTDASDDGFDGCLFQTVDKIDQPVAYVR